MKKNLSLQFPLDRKDYTELFEYMPYFKSIFKLATVGNLVALFLFCTYNIIANFQIAVDGVQFLILNIVTVVIGLVLYFVILFLTRTFFRKVIEKRSRKLYNLYYDTNPTYQIGYDPRFDAFVLGKEKKKIPADQSLTVFSTENNYLFYVGKGRGQEDKFLLPKDGSKDQQLKVDRIIIMLEEKGIEIKEGKGI
ncbi:hypothetical protein AB685_15700 [Bacillus sp. LL01]|uniref:hypothetical protein n=1 Tax=Bacillus sp. LL01 TaxID=1665556 RepID=UPI00064D3CFE|nr:hypothetical protein [Bacillus sp. LL01]KMJ57460.1 hypothetical protein AB685_15700 [Bacillus sp. LL01]